MQQDQLISKLEKETGAEPLEYRIYADHQTTRRQRLHYVVDRQEVLSFTSADIGQCIAHVVDKGHQNMILMGRTSAFVVTVKASCVLRD